MSTPTESQLDSADTASTPNDGATPAAAHAASGGVPSIEVEPNAASPANTLPTRAAPPLQPDGTSATIDEDLEGYTRRPILVPAAVVVAILITLCTVVLLGRKWYVTTLPNAAIVLFSEDESAEGVDVAVRTREGRLVARGKLTSGDDFTFIVLVEEGEYIVQAKLNESQFLEQGLYIGVGQGVRVQVRVPPELLHAAVPETQPAERPARIPPPEKPPAARPAGG